MYLDEHFSGTGLRNRLGAVCQRLRWRPACLDDDGVHLLLVDVNFGSHA